MNQRYDNFQEIADEIQEFIDYKREPDQIIKARVREISQTDNIITLELEEDFNFYRGALIVINGVSGSVVDKYSNIINISTKDEHGFHEGDKVKIDSSKMNLIIDRLEKTITRIKDNNLDENNINTLQFILGNNIPQYHLKDVNFNSETLNISQKDAIKHSLGADNFHLIIGPPGTGKTYVITEIIEQLHSKNKIVLITAWTNNAVDNILEKFQNYSPKRILRIGSFREVSPSCQKFTLEQRRQQSNDWKEVKQLDELIKKHEQSIRYLTKERKNLQYGINNLKFRKKEYQEKIDTIMVIKRKILYKIFRIRDIKH